MFPVDVPETIKEPPLLMVKPSDSLIVKSFTAAPVDALINGALVTSGIVASRELVGTPLSQLLAVAQSVSVLPVQVVEVTGASYKWVPRYFESVSAASSTALLAT